MSYARFFTPDFIDALRNRKCAVFLGAGFSFSSGIPSASALFRYLKQTDELSAVFHRAGREISNIWELANACDSPHIRASSVFKQLIAHRLSVSTSILSSEVRALAFLIKLGFVKEVYTTNQDTVLEDALDVLRIPYNRYINEQNAPAPEIVNSNVSIFKLCGDSHSPRNMCFSKQDFDCAVKTEFLASFLSKLQVGAFSHLLFLGYSFGGGDALSSTDTLSERLFAHLRECKTLQFCIVDPYPNARQEELVQNSMGLIYEKAADDFLESLIRELQPPITVAHILFDTEGIGGVQTYYYALKEICRRRYGDKLTFVETVTKPFMSGRKANGQAKGMSFYCAAGTAKAYEVVAGKAFDLIHSHNFMSAYKAFELDAPVLLTSHSMEDQEMLYDTQADSFGKSTAELEKQYYSALPSIITLSEAARAYLPSSVRHAALPMAAPFILDSFTASSQPSRADARRAVQKQISMPDEGKHSWRSDIPTISYFGRAATRKGLETFIDAMNLLASKETPFQVLFVGPTIETSDSNTLVFKLDEYSSGSNNRRLLAWNKQVNFPVFIGKVSHANGNLSFDGHQRQMCAFYQASDLVVVPSYYETFGYVVVESMASKTPVLTSSDPALLELVAEGRGYFVQDQANILETQKCYKQLQDIRDSAESNEKKRMTQTLNETLDALKYERASMYSEKIHEILLNLNSHTESDMISRASIWVEQKYGKTAMTKLAEAYYEKYLDTILNGSERPLLAKDNAGFNQVEYANKVKSKLRDQDSFEEVLAIDLDFYQEINGELSRLVPSYQYGEENYNLYWMLAVWTKQSAMLIEEIRLISTKNLAELITHANRALHAERQPAQKENA